MAAPSGTKWGDIKGSYGRIGIYVGLTNTDTQTTASIQVWFWSKYSVSDSNNRFWYNHDATSATTEKTGDISIRHTVSSGSGWSTSNQTRLATYSKTYSRTSSAQKKNCAAKFSGIDSVASGSAMTVTTSFTIPALPSYTVTYDANGGTGAPASQSKMHGTTIAVSSTEPTRTGHSFLGWASSAESTDIVYSAGSSYTANASITLYAVWLADTYDVIFEANGGAGAPSNLIKTYDMPLALPSVVPTRTNYNFLGWSASSNATSALYKPGDMYEDNSGITLYAVWELAYIPPRIASISSSRCESDGTMSDEGTYFKIAFSWATDKEISSIQIRWQSTTDASGGNYNVPATGTDGEVSIVLGSGNISTENAYTVRITVADEIGSSNASRSIPSLTYAIDFLKGGKGVSIGKPAKKQNVFEVGFTQHDKFGTLVGNGLAAYTGTGPDGIDPNYTSESLILTDVNTPGSEGLMYISTIFYETKSATANRVQRAIPYEAFGSTYQRYYFDGVWSPWINETLRSWPVNSIYTAFSHVSPAEEFGGTWARISPYFLYATGEAGVIGETGGEAEHVLTVNELPSHKHPTYNGAGWAFFELNRDGTAARTQVATSSSSGKYTFTATKSADIQWAYNQTGVLGGGAGHSNIPPFIKVSVWRRVE